MRHQLIIFLFLTTLFSSCTKTEISVPPSDELAIDLKTRDDLRQFETHEASLNAWSNPNHFFDEASDIKNASLARTDKPLFNFRPCWWGSCSGCCTGAAGICFCWRDGQKPFQIGNGVLTHTEFSEGLGYIDLAIVNEQWVQVTYLDRYNYNQDFKTYVSQDLHLDRTILEQYGILNYDEILIPQAKYEVYDSENSKFGSFYVPLNQ